MRLGILLSLSVVSAIVLPLYACGSDGGSSFPNGGPGGGDGGTGDGGNLAPRLAADGGTLPGSNAMLTNVQVLPANATLAVAAGQSATQAYTVMAVVNGAGPAVDVTRQFAFYVPDNYLVGGFPTSGAPTFTTRLPTVSTDPPQQGGKLTVQAQARNGDGTVLTAKTSLTVDLSATLTSTSGGAVPSNPASLFKGTTADPARAPVLAYPNDGVMLPPNLKQLEVHWQPGASKNTLYEISFRSPSSLIVYYTRCGDVATGHLSSGACSMLLDQTGYAYLAQSNAGQGPVTLGIRATDDTGTGWGQSAAFTIQFAQTPVNGGVYYWNVSATSIMRFDFGGTATTPDVFIAPGNYGLPSTGTTCVGCHTISRDGTKIAASIGGQNDGRLVYQANLAKASNPPAPTRTDPTWLTLAGDSSTNNKIQFASFSPTADRLVAIYGDTGSTSDSPGFPGSLDRNKLWFHDGTTGMVTHGAEKVLTFEPDHPTWSPDGTMIAMTHVGIHATSQRARNGGIDVATFSGTTLGDPVPIVPIVPGKNRYNPDFVPDSSFLYYSEIICPGGPGSENNDNCDADVQGNTVGTTWVVKPTPNATPVHLDNASKMGVADTTTPLDTFPKSTPFVAPQGAGKLFWFTVASQRAPGLRARTDATQQLLWMFAVDPAKIAAGQDGSYTGFFLPFQDLTTSNHIAQWTQKVVGGQTPPPPPAIPGAPPPPNVP